MWPKEQQSTNLCRIGPHTITGRLKFKKQDQTNIKWIAMRIFSNYLQYWIIDGLVLQKCNHLFVLENDPNGSNQKKAMNLYRFISSKLSLNFSFDPLLPPNKNQILIDRSKFSFYLGEIISKFLSRKRLEQAFSYMDDWVRNHLNHHRQDQSENVQWSNLCWRIF